MDWEAALDLVVARTGVGRYRWLCSDANEEGASRDAYRRLMMDLAGMPMPMPDPGEQSPEDRALVAYVEKHGCCPEAQ